MYYSFRCYTQGRRETIRLGKTIGACIEPGTVIALIGPLGSGKTTLTKGIAAGAGVAPLECVTSPSFTIMNMYQGFFPVYHFDLYRLASVADLYEIGFDDFIDGEGLSIIEWGDKAADRLPPRTITIRITMVSGIDNDNSKRVFRFTATQRSLIDTMRRAAALSHGK